MGLEHATDVPATYPQMALRLHFHAQSARTVVLAVVGKRLAHRYFSSQQLPTALPAVVGSRGHAQHLAKLADGHVSGPLGDVAVGAHRVSWLSLRLRQATGQSFFKLSSSCSAHLRQARRARTSGSWATSSLPTSATSCCYQQ
ncbi:hypothetical protein J4D97_21935 [Hymenobacter defluvii]|uniref:Uncharacterized protein n=1 Tax=Hymenobacter defluvii TaxID=2054411 RepID=A0ABS3TI38_9BACT|nr:hypothetical protein [Hymenobacter defluvii]